MKVLYKTSAVSTGGRDGQAFIENTPIHFEMALPPELDGKKPNGFNPEQFFAAGYASCFGSALQHVFAVRKVNVATPDVHVTVGIGKNKAGGFALAAEIEVVFTGIEQATADELVAEAHQVCPYSNATRGNVDVAVSAKVK